jgi:uncharacterized spore protein YtfJ
MNIDEMVKGTQDATSVRRVYGDPVERDGTTLIPAAAVRGGGGGGGDAENNGGGGFGLTARPVGAYVIREGQVRWEPAIDVNRIVFMGQLVAIVMLLVLRSMVKARYRAKR